jgi:hypothetical protein
MRKKLIANVATVTSFSVFAGVFGFGVHEAFANPPGAPGGPGGPSVKVEVGVSVPKPEVPQPSVENPGQNQPQPEAPKKPTPPTNDDQKPVDQPATPPKQPQPTEPPSKQQPEPNPDFNQPQPKPEPQQPKQEKPEWQQPKWTDPAPEQSRQTQQVRESEQKKQEPFQWDTVPGKAKQEKPQPKPQPKQQPTDQREKPVKKAPATEKSTRVMPVVVEEPQQQTKQDLQQSKAVHKAKASTTETKKQGGEALTQDDAKEKPKGEKMVKTGDSSGNIVWMWLGLVGMGATLMLRSWPALQRRL